MIDAKGLQCSTRMRCRGATRLAALSCAAVLLLGPAAAVAGNSGPVSCSVLDDCSQVDALPTADSCEADDCACAQQIECYLRGQDPSASWPLLPGESLSLNRNFFHNRFIETRISPQSLNAWEHATDPASGPANLPNGTVVYKLGYLPSSDDVSVPATPAQSAYVFVKLSGYCPDGSRVGDFCLGGDWFALEVNNNTYGILEPGQLLETGKAENCFGCHAAAEDGDWLWQLFTRRRFPETGDGQ